MQTKELLVPCKENLFCAGIPKEETIFIQLSRNEEKQPLKEFQPDRTHPNFTNKIPVQMILINPNSGVTTIMNYSNWGDAVSERIISLGNTIQRESSKLLTHFLVDFRSCYFYYVRFYEYIQKYGVDRLKELNILSNSKDVKLKYPEELNPGDDIAEEMLLAIFFLGEQGEKVINEAKSEYRELCLYDELCYNVSEKWDRLYTLSGLISQHVDFKGTDGVTRNINLTEFVVRKEGFVTAFAKPRVSDFSVLNVLQATSLANLSTLVEAFAFIEELDASEFDTSPESDKVGGSEFSITYNALKKSFPEIYANKPF